MVGHAADRLYRRDGMSPPPEWQVPCGISRPPRRPSTFSLPLANRFHRLPEEEEPTTDLEPEGPVGAQGHPAANHVTGSPANHGQNPHSPTQAELGMRGGVKVQPHGDSYFLPGKVAGKAVTFLLDSGCTTNLLSRRVFKTLPRQDRDRV